MKQYFLENAIETNESRIQDLLIQKNQYKPVRKKNINADYQT